MTSQQQELLTWVQQTYKPADVLAILKPLIGKYGQDQVAGWLNAGLGVDGTAQLISWLNGGVVVPAPTPTPTPTPTPIPPADAGLRALKGPGWIAGPVNFWYDQDFAKLAASLSANGALGAIIEFRGAGAQFGVSGVPSLDVLVSRLDKLAAALKAVGLWLWVIDANWNSPYKKNPISQFKAEADKILAVLNRYNNIIAQPVSERMSSKSGVDEKKALELFKHYESKFTGPMAWNIVSSSDKCPSRYVIADYHVSSTSQIGGKAGKINATSTDHSTVLAEIHGGDRNGQVADVKKLVPHAQKAWAAGQIYVWYEFFHKTPDYASYNALGAAWKAFNGGTLPSTPTTPTTPPTDDFAGITKWNGANISAWPVTIMVSDVEVRGDNIYWKEGPGRDGKWNQFTGSNGKTINGECGLVLPARATAGMFDYVKRGQHDKVLDNLDGPGGFLGNGRPASGERAGFYINTISRDKANAKMKERSNVFWFVWP